MIGWGHILTSKKNLEKNNAHCGFWIQVIWQWKKSFKNKEQTNKHANKQNGKEENKNKIVRRKWQGEGGSVFITTPSLSFAPDN